MCQVEEALEELNKRLIEISTLVESAIHGSVLALVEKDAEHADRVLRSASRINQTAVEAGRLTTRRLAVQASTVADLRFVATAIEITNSLEGAGELAATVAKTSLPLIYEPVSNALIDIAHMAKLAELMVRKAVDSFVKRDADLARGVLVSLEAVHDLRAAIEQELALGMQRESRRTCQGFGLLLISRNFDLIADHAVKIAENVLSLVDEVGICYLSRI